MSAVRRLRDDPELARRMGENGRRTVREHFGREPLAHRMLDVLLSVAEGGPVGARGSDA